jgi:uncharacterized oxidoreductase
MPSLGLLRVQLTKTNIKVFEFAPPGTETPLLRGDFDETDLGGVTGMDVTRHACHQWNEKRRAGNSPRSQQRP